MQKPEDLSHRGLSFSFRFKLADLLRFTSSQKPGNIMYWSNLFQTNFSTLQHVLLMQISKKQQLTTEVVSPRIYFQVSWVTT